MLTLKAVLAFVIANKLAVLGATALVIKAAQAVVALLLLAFPNSAALQEINNSLSDLGNNLPSALKAKFRKAPAAPAVKVVTAVLLLAGISTLACSAVQAHDIETCSESAIVNSLPNILPVVANLLNSDPSAASDLEGLGAEVGLDLVECAVIEVVKPPATSAVVKTRAKLFLDKHPVK